MSRTQTNILTRECYKKPHLSKDDAKKFQKKISGKTKFHVYLCPVCAYWHVSVHFELDKNILKKFAKMIQSQSKCTKPIKKISNSQSIHEIQYNNETFRVIYNSRQKKVRLA